MKYYCKEPLKSPKILKKSQNISEYIMSEYRLIQKRKQSIIKENLY